MILNQRDRGSQIESVLKNAGAILLRFFRHSVVAHQKSGDKGLVTQADIESEQYLIQALSQLMPEASFMAEESGVSGTSDYRWVIDPLDGTTNFAHGLAHFSISVALTHNGVPVVAAVYSPSTDEFFYAEQGGGAFLNGSPIRVSEPTSFERGTMVLGLPYAKNPRYEQIFKDIKKGEDKLPFSVRHFGSAALDMAFVACGRMDGIFFADLYWWDVAAGALIIQEAGGMVTDFEGKPVNEQYTTCLAASKRVHVYLLPLIGRK